MIEVALTALGLSTTPMEDGGKNIGISIDHNDDQLKYEDGEEVSIDEQNYEVDGKTYPDVKKEELPKLSIASDILAAYWLRSPTPQNLKYWFGQDVTNEDTVPIIIKILLDHGYTEGVPTWPGLQLNMPSEETLVLLGSPIGSTVAFFLIQHKEELGLKHVSSITIFRDLKTEPDHNAEVQLLFRIDDVPQDDILPEDTEMLDEGTKVKHTRRGIRRKDSMVDLDLGRNLSRAHEMSLGERGETVPYSHEFKREL
ncbi:hypothetical protein AA0111_g4651 [Alternaria arborescens]|uniref:hypothetical protein n=1 Tax=Alternaria arborescens TaxID=156630 RepID=UPI001074D783|nr:hypothetical protein AA0111_g4651 [Alternaria arborescens]RYO32543.1 hypothetical protein AA0111_g4651 [Alternaria arborescens]